MNAAFGTKMKIEKGNDTKEGKKRKTGIQVS